MCARNETYEKKEKRAIAKIEEFLEAKRRFWYPNSVIIYERRSAYFSFDDMLKREILYTGYSAKELLVGLTIKVSSDWRKLDFMFSFKSGDSGTSLPSQGILEVLQGRGLMTEVRFYTEKDKEVEDQSTFFAREREIAIQKAKSNGFGRVSIYNFFRGRLLYLGTECEVVGYAEGPELYWLSILKDEEAHVLSDEGEIKDLMTSILDEWLLDKQPVQFNWSRQEKLESKNEGYLLQVFTEVSEISVDASFDENTQVFRWRNEGFSAQCKSSTTLLKDDVEDIIKKSGLKIPADAELVGIAPYREDIDTPCLMARYLHVVVDEDFERLETVPALHQNPGKIIVEGDFCTFYIDPENRRVVSKYRKWRPIKGT